MTAGWLRVLVATHNNNTVEAYPAGVTKDEVSFVLNQFVDAVVGEHGLHAVPRAVGIGGEDHAAFLRAEEACVRVERHSGAAFDDLEKDVETVAKKLSVLDAHDARINAKEKERLLKRNAKFWREDGLNSCAFDVVEKSVLRESPALTCVQFKVEMKCARPGYIKCFTCATWLPEPEYSGKALAAVRWSEKTGTKHERSCTSCTANLPKQIETEAQKAFNAYIRYRDRNLPCVSCDKPNDGSHQRHASHYRSVKACSALRFNEMNVHASCMQCNSHMSGNITEYRIRLIKKIGLEMVAWIESQNKVTRYTCEELKNIELKYKKMIK